MSIVGFGVPRLAFGRLAVGPGLRSRPRWGQDLGATAISNADERIAPDLSRSVDVSPHRVPSAWETTPWAYQVHAWLKSGAMPSWEKTPTQRAEIFAPPSERLGRPGAERQTPNATPASRLAGAFVR